MVSKGGPMDWIWLAAGLALLVLGAEALVRGGVGLARRLGVSPLLIGVTIVGYGTSTPELVVSVDAALKGLDGIAVGNVVGSNIFNILFILGVTALVAPIGVPPAAIRRDASFALGAAALFITIALSMPALTFWIGVLCLSLLAGIVILTFVQERQGGTASGDLHTAQAEEVQNAPGNAAASAALLAGGLACLVVGGSWLVDAAAAIARGFGISEVMIGLTLVAAGTSLPELATSAIAALRRHPDVALGNILGSNIYNILGILGVASTIAPTAIPPQIVAEDMWIMAAATLLLVPAMVTGRVGRPLAAAMLAGYAAYVWRLVALS